MRLVINNTKLEVFKNFQARNISYIGKKKLYKQRYFYGGFLA